MKKAALFTGSAIFWFLVFVLVGPSLFSSCSSSDGYISNGKRIYFTAESSSEQPITYIGSIRMMHTISCVNCHRQDGKGGRVTMMMYAFDTPDITWPVLTQEEHEEESGHEEHGEHPSYKEETLKRAIVEGVDPAGERLDDEMPRWRMSEQDLDDLVEFIKTLD